MTQREQNPKYYALVLSDRDTHQLYKTLFEMYKKKFPEVMQILKEWGW
jgi:hypothetical protein